MAIETIIAALVALVGLLCAVFGLGHRRGIQSAEQRQNAEDIAASVATTEKRLEAVKNANYAQQDVNALSDDDVDRRLREQWTRPGSD